MRERVIGVHLQRLQHVAVTMNGDFPADASAITDRALEDAASERGSALEMLRHLGKIITTKDGIARLLTMFAYVAASDWIDGDLQVDVTGNASECSAAFLVGLGMGKMERVLPPIPLAIDFDRFKADATRESRYAEPLVPASQSNRLAFALPDAISRSTSPPEYVTVASQSLSSPYVAIPRDDANKNASEAITAPYDVRQITELDPALRVADPLAVDEPFADDEPHLPKK